MKISLITPLYNKAAYIAETIDSVLAQTHRDWEWIIVDNGSTDGGPEVVSRKLEGISSEYSVEIQDQKNGLGSIGVPTCAERRPASDIPHILFLTYTENKGPGAARNFGLSYATGEWVLFLDADDLIEPEHLEQLHRCAQDNSHADVVAGGWKEFTAGQSNAMKECRPAGENRNLDFLRAYSIANAPWAVHAAMIRRSLLFPPYVWEDALDGFPSEDTAFWFRVIMRANVAYSEKSGALYRLGLSESRNRPEDVEIWFQAMRQIIDANLSFLQMQGMTIQAAQCEYIMRRYSDIFLRARRMNAIQTSREALDLAQNWLNECRQRNGIQSIALRIRVLFGLKLFLRFIR